MANEEQYDVQALLTNRASVTLTEGGYRISYGEQIGNDPLKVKMHSAIFIENGFLKPYIDLLVKMATLPRTAQSEDKAAAEDGKKAKNALQS